MSKPEDEFPLPHPLTLESLTIRFDADERLVESEPRTEAGREHLAASLEWMMRSTPDTDGMVWWATEQVIRASIAAIEVEARRATVDRIRARLSFLHLADIDIATLNRELDAEAQR